MLVLSRKVGEEIVIGSDIRVSVVAVKGNRVRIGITAPRDVNIVRGELAEPELDSFWMSHRELRERAATDSHEFAM